MTVISSSVSSVAVIDYGMGNLHSVASALKHIAPSAEVIVTGDSKIIADADRVVFPGVGAIRDCMGEIRARGFDVAVQQEIDSGKPVLAVCVGLQALMTSSAENGGVDCLGVFSGKVQSFSATPEFQIESKKNPDDHLKVPHMGWNTVSQTPHPLWHGIDNNSRFYFVHSYYVALNSLTQQEQSLITGTSEYGMTFAAAMARGNLFAAQFHPEKSHTGGLQLLKNFMSWDGKA